MFYKTIKKDWLHSEPKEFVTEYEWRLSSFLEKERILSGQDFMNINQTEIRFAKICLNYLKERNEYLLEKYRQKEEDSMRNYCKSKHVDYNSFFEKAKEITRFYRYKNGTPQFYEDYLQYTKKLDEKVDETSQKYLDEVKEEWEPHFFNEKVGYLSLKLHRLGYEVEWGKEIVFNKQKFYDDLSPETDRSKSKCTEKIIYLKELGVLDFLKTKEPFNKSVRKLAKTLVPILGEPYGTIQPVLNSVIRENFNKNNPYSNSSNKKVQNIRTQLIEMGMSFCEE